MRKIICSLIVSILTVINVNAQSITEIQAQNARATGYAIVAAKNPGKSFSIYMIKWDGVNSLEYNANNQINSTWHPQAAIKGNYFDQPFVNHSFTGYSSVVVSQSEFDTYKSTGTDWWIVCSTLPSFSNSGLSISNNGNIGIGTTNPQQKFVVSNNEAEGLEIYLNQPSNIVGIQSYNRNINAYSKMQLNASQFSFLNGKVGFGTTNPQQNFVVSNNNAEGFEVYLDPLRSVIGLQSYNRSLNAYSKMQLDASQFSFMIGKVGIGKMNPSNELDVNGTIHSKEVKVDMTGWSDFVFKKEYNLPTLEEVEKHIAEKGHLENIPSEEEVLRNGISLGEMNAKLLQKIEELTLYLIDKDKQINFLLNENSIIKKNSDDLKKTLLERLEKLETKIN